MVFITVILLNFIGNIREPPQNRSTEVGSLATFNCTICQIRNATTLTVWMFNRMKTQNQSRFNSSRHSGPDSSQIYSLTFIAQPEDDGGIIQCQIYDISDDPILINSTSAFLTLSTKG